MSESEHHEHRVTHHRFDELKAEYCRRCGLPVSAEQPHDHDQDAESTPS